MLTNIDGVACLVNALNCKYVDIEFKEVDITDSLIQTVFEMFGNQPFYAIRIKLTSSNLNEYLSRTFGFVNGVMWSSKRKPPLEEVFSELLDGSALTQTRTAFGDIVYHTGIFSGTEYLTPLGVQDGVNILIHLENAPFRVLNPIWDGTMNYQDQIAVQLPVEVERYLFENQLVLSSESKLHTLGTNYQFLYNPYNDGITITGDSLLNLKSNQLVCYNGQVNVPIAHSIYKIGKFGIDKKIFERTDAIIFEHNRLNYLCIPDMNLLANVSKAEVTNWFTIKTPLGRDAQGGSINILHWVHEKGAERTNEQVN